MKRTFNTLFMLSSVDGKISTGSVDKRDTDKDFWKIKGVKEGLQQYYNIEKTTDRHSFNTGKVMRKINANNNRFKLNCPDVSFIIIDNSHLTEKGIKNLIERTKKLYFVTNNKNHPAFKFKERLELIYYPSKIDFKDLFKTLKQKYKVARVTIQSGGTVNSILIREGLIDKISFVFAPCLIGGRNTSSLVDGKDMVSESDLKHIKSLKLKQVKKLKNNYLHLLYDVINKQYSIGGKNKN